MTRRGLFSGMIGAFSAGLALVGLKHGLVPDVATNKHDPSGFPSARSYSKFPILTGTFTERPGFRCGYNA